MKKIISALTAITLSLCIIPTLTFNANADYSLTYQSENIPDLDDEQKTSFFLMEDTTTTQVIVPNQNEEGKLYISARLHWCSAVERIFIGENVYYIFLEECPNLKEIHIDEANPYFNEIDGVVYNEEMTELLFYSRAKEDTSFTIPDTVKTIYPYAFAFNSYLEEIIIPEGITDIQERAFYNCSLNSVTLPHSLEKIGLHCFDTNPNLKEITIPEKIAVLQGILENCEALEKITFLNSSDDIYQLASSLGGSQGWGYINTFGEDRVNPITAYVPDNQIEQYTQMAKDGWNCDYEILPLSQKPVENPQPTGIKGDVNCDNDLNIADLVILSKWITDSNGLSAQNMNDSSAADMNSDGLIDVFDSVLLRTALVAETETTE